VESCPVEDPCCRESKTHSKRDGIVIDSGVLTLCHYIMSLTFLKIRPNKSVFLCPKQCVLVKAWLKST